MASSQLADVVKIRIHARRADSKYWRVQKGLQRYQRVMNGIFAGVIVKIFIISR